MKNQRRIFLKVLMTGPLVGCSGADAGSSLPDDVGGGAGKSGVGAGSSGAAGVTSSGSGSGGALGAGSSSGGASNVAGANTVAGAATSTGGNPFASGGTFGSGGTFASGSSAGTTAAGGAVAGGAAAGGAAGSGSGDLNPFIPIAAGNVSAVAVGSLAIVERSFLLGRDAQGLFAMSLQCTHQSCAVTITGSELYCPCHKSRFDGNGNVLAGPATKPLPHFAVSVDAGGNISVLMSAVVSASTRTKV